MRPNDIEYWALSIIERVESRQPVEDLRVELKSEWPKDYNKAGRQIAGHANAAHGEPILWLIGIDERKGVTGVDYEEISNWSKSVEAQFDGLAPPLTHLNVPYKDKTVVALLWETERRLFVVKNPLFGRRGGGNISLEVPWRDAGSTRTATRTDLLQMLHPVSKNPSFEIRRAEFEIVQSGGRPAEGWLKVQVYIVPRSGARVVIPYHKCQVTLRPTDSDLSFNAKRVWFEPSDYLFPGQKSQSAISYTSTEAIISGPGMALIGATGFFASQGGLSPPRGNVDIELKLCQADRDTPIPILATLCRTKAKQKGKLAQWATAGARD